MAQAIASKKPIQGINRDVAFEGLKDTQARYMLNFERSINDNPTGMGANEGKLTPVPANRLLSLPALNFPGLTSIRAFESPFTKEVYVWAYSDSTAHTIYRINPNLTITIVYQGADLGLSDDPVHAVRGAYLFYNSGRKFLLWVDGRQWQGFLDVETSIATNSFHVPYFQLGEFEQEQYWQLPTRPPLHCVGGEWIDIDPDNTTERDKLNKMLDLTWQFRYKYIYTDGRDSEWSPISTLFYVERSESQKDAAGLPRCLRLTISAGHPQVEKIVIAYRNCNGNAYAESNPFDFQEFLRFNKYQECLDDVPFWQRGIRDDEVDGSISYDPDTNDFTIIFCGDGTCIDIDVNETNRTQNPCPITSYALGVVEHCLVLLNNIEGYDQVDCNLGKKLLITLHNPTGSECKVEYAEVKVSLIIHNIHRMVNEPIFTYESDAAKNRKFFGGLMYRKGSTPFDDPGPYLQYFPDTQEGFIIYDEATKNYCITRQWKDESDYGAENDFNSGSKRREVSRFLDDDKYYVSYGTIRVIKGTKGYLRVGGNRSRPTENFSDTSSTVIGILRDLGSYSAKQNIYDHNRLDSSIKEIYFDTCGGDVDLTNTPFVVADLSAPYGDLANPFTATAITGYLRDKNKEPVPQADIEHLGNARGGSFDSIFTDHNGFYFASWAMNDVQIGAPSLKVQFFVESGTCTKVLGKESTVMQGGGAMPNITNERNFTVDDVVDYENQSFALVRLRVQDCRGAAMPGVPLVIRGYKGSVTDNNGLVSVFIRNRVWAYGSAWTAKAVVGQSSSGYTVCNTTCSTCMPEFDINFPSCFSSNPLIDILQGGVNAIVLLDPFFGSSRGLKPGGRYGFAPIFHDAAGRHSWVPDDAVMVDFPTIQEMQAFGFSAIQWAIPQPLNLPLWVKHMSIVRTSNTAFTFMLQWPVNAVSFVDSSGQVTTSANAEKIRLSIQSLIDRNTQQLGANTTYQWVAGDRLLVIAKDDATRFTPGTGSLDFLIEGAVTIKTEATENTPARESYELIIRYDNRIKDIKEGALIEILRPVQCETEQPFFELCDTIDVIDGEPVMTTGFLSTFDTYQLRRSITWNSIKHIFAFPFEHHSPNDFWGSRCDDRGRVFFKNIWAKQLHADQSAWISDAILDNGNRNGLSTFRSERRKVFKSNTRGAITACYSMDRALKIVCEHGNFVAIVGDDLLRMGRDGVAHTAGADQILAETSQGSSRYGLQYEDTLACIFGPGWSMWVDAHEKAIVWDDYQNPTDITQGLIQADFSTKLQYREQFNQGKTGLDRIRIVMGYDPVGKWGLVTFRARGWANGYIADRGDQIVDKNETFAVSLLDQNIFMFSYTPECYGCMHSSTKGNVFFSFKNGLPWVHREKGSTRFNEFFGVPCNQRMIIVLNNEKDILKIPISMQQQTLHKYYADKVTCTGTDSRTEQIFIMESEIPPACVKLYENKYSGSFLFNKLTPNKDMPLWKGETLKGHYIIISLIRDNTVDNKLTQIDPARMIKYNELDQIFFIYAQSANSAYQTDKE
jgi:hypothetical protein